MFSYTLTSDLTTLRTFIEFDWLVHLLECYNVLTTNCNLQKVQLCVSTLGMYINIRIVYPFRSLVCVCVFLIMRIIGFMTEVYEKLPYLLEVEPKQGLLILGYCKRIFSIILKPIDIQWIKTGS